MANDGPPTPGAQRGSGASCEGRPEPRAERWVAPAMIQHGSRTHGAADRVWPTGSTPGTRVVVVGAGLGGLWAAKALAGNGLDVLLLDRNNYHTFLPLLYQVAAAELAPSDIAYPIRSILRKSRDIRFRLAEIHTVDLSRRVVESDAGPVPYDYLILALGSVPHFFGVEGASIHAFPLREMGRRDPASPSHALAFRSGQSRDGPGPDGAGS